MNISNTICRVCNTVHDLPMCPDELPCPFCGSDDQQITDYSSERGDGAIVECVNCGAQGPFAKDGELAAKAWDTRPTGSKA